MNGSECGQLLALMALYDNRKVSDPDVMAWLRVIGDLDYADAEASVYAHYGSVVTERMLPGHVRQGVRSIRGQRIARSVIPAPPAELADHPAAYKAALAEQVRRAGDGELPAAPPRLAIAGGTPAIERKPGPPVRLGAALREFRRTLGPARPRRVTAMHPQDIATQQAAEARAQADRDDEGEAS